jgi:hypothetical protein
MPSVRQCCGLFLLCSFGWAAQLQVEIRNHEVWVIRGGQARQLTRDGKAKEQVELSPSGTQIAYYEACPQGEGCVPAIVILDLDGARQKAFPVMAEAIGAPEPCASILRIWWPAEATIAAECHRNPSLSEYVETDLRTGKTIKDLLGYGFTPSPDGKYVAHVGPNPHFAPPPAHSNYLQIDKLTVYPLPKGARPGEQRPEVARQGRTRWTGIHNFVSDFFWSPDSERVAFVDGLSDWDETAGAGDGFTDVRYFVVVVSRSGRAELFALELPGNVSASKVTFAWDGPHRVSAKIGSTVRTFGVP